MGIAAIISLIISVLIWRKYDIDYRYTIFLIGILLAIIPLVNIQHINVEIILQIMIPWILIVAIFTFIGRYWKLYRNKINLSILAVHVFDATTTFIAVDFYNYQEQHVLPRFLYDLSSTALTMYPLKIVAITLALYLIDEYIDDENINGLLKLTVFVLGLAPGLRNCLTMAMGI